MNTRQIAIVTLLVGGLAFWFSGGDDDGVPPVEPPARQAPRQHAPVVPSLPELQEPRFDYGIAGTFRNQGPYPDTRAGATPYGSGYGAQSYPYGWPEASSWRFRPLNERERRRMGMPEPGFDSLPPQTTYQTSPYRPGDQAPYRFRSPGGRYEGPYPTPQTPRWDTAPDYAERWELPPQHEPIPSPQPSWDHPSRRMLPSLDWSPDHRFSAR